MAQPVTGSELKWLRELDRLLRSGLTREQAAARLGVSNQTISYRLQKWGVRVVWEPRLGSAVNGQDLEAMLAEGELLVGQRGPGRSRSWRPVQPTLGVVERNAMGSGVRPDGEPV